MKYDYLVVGAGFTGLTFAQQKAQKGKTVLVIDQRSHLGGNAYDYADGDIHVHKYGPHLFHTNSGRVFNYLSEFTEWRKYEHRVVAQIAVGLKVPLPFNSDSVISCFNHEEAKRILSALRKSKIGKRFTLNSLRGLSKESNDADLKKLADYVFEYVFKNYTQKMWGLTLEELGPTVSDRVPLVRGHDSRYFADTFQCMPINGYAELFDRMMKHPNITVSCETGYIKELDGIADRVLYTGSIDDYFDRRHGALPYRGITFDIMKSNDFNSLFPTGVSTVNFPNEGEFTRVTSMRSVNGLMTLETDTVVLEKPNDIDRYYPVPIRANRDLYDLYAKDAEAVTRVRFAGRLGSYTYLNMDQAVGQALKISKEF